MTRKSRSPEEQAEFEAMLNEIPELRRLKESGHSFADVWDSENMKPLNPLPSEEEVEAMVPDSSVERIVGRAFGKAGQRYVPKAQRQPQAASREPQAEEDHSKILNFPTLPRRFSLGQMIGALAAAVLLMFGGELGVAYMNHESTGYQMAQERVHLHTTVRGRTIIQAGSAMAPRSFDIGDADIRGSVREGSLDIEEIGSAADSMVHATLSLLGDVRIAVGQKSHGMVVSTPTAEVELDPGDYSITAPNKEVGYVTVIQGEARVDDRGTPLDIGRARTGQTIKTRKGKLPTRNMSEP